MADRMTAPFVRCNISVTFEAMNARHLDALVRLDQDGVPPYFDKDTFKTFLALRSHTCLVATGVPANGPPLIVGYAVAARKTVGIRLSAVATHSEYRRLGIASHMIQHLVDRYPTAPFWAAVSEAWLPAHLLLKKCGFRCTAILHGRDIGSHVPVLYLFENRTNHGAQWCKKVKEKS